MLDKIQEMQEKLKSFGYFASESLAKAVLLFLESGKKNRKSIPTLLLQGPSGAGKTFLAETFSKMIGAEKKFVQCFPRMGTENFQYDVNIEAILKKEAEHSIKPGILLQAIKQSHISPVVLVIDELDKSRPEVDSFLLDFLENGRLTTGTDTYEKGNFPIYAFITSNNKREIDEALINRSKNVTIPRPEKKLFLEILGLQETHYLGYVYDKCPTFSIRQAKQYLDDLTTLDVEFDEYALSMYINLDDLEILSLEDLKNLSALEKKDFEFELPNLSKCKIRIDSNNQAQWKEILKSKNGKNFTVYTESDDSGNPEFYVDIDSVEQLSLVSEYINFHDNNNFYSGWFEYNIPYEEIGDTVWAENKSGKDRTRFGLKFIGNKIFRLASNRGITFIYLDSTNNSLERFRGEEKDYETDKSYDEGNKEDTEYEDDF